MAEVILGNVLTKEAMILDHPPFTNKEELFQLLAQKFLDAGVITSKTAFLRALHEREELGPTYMGNFIGLPHGRCDEVIKSGIAFCRCIEPFQYESFQEVGDVKYVFMLAIPGTQSGDQYMRVLATLAGLLAKDEFINQLDSIHSYEEMLELMETCA